MLTTQAEPDSQSFRDYLIGKKLGIVEALAVSLLEEFDIKLEQAWRMDMFMSDLLDMVPSYFTDYRNNLLPIDIDTVSAFMIWAHNNSQEISIYPNPSYATKEL